MSEHVSDQQLSSLIDGQLSLASRQAVIEHVRSCPRCAARQDELVEVAAVMQAAPSLVWSETSTDGVLERIRGERRRPSHRTRPSRDWTLPIAGALAVIGLAAVTIFIPPLAHDTLGGSGLDAIRAVTPGAGVLWSGHFVVALAVVIAVGAFALPLIRAR